MNDGILGSSRAGLEDRELLDRSLLVEINGYSSDSGPSISFSTRGSSVEGMLHFLKDLPRTSISSSREIIL
jgi:hypothetical protein